MSFVLYLVVSVLARLVASSGDAGSKDIEILVLRHQLKVPASVRARPAHIRSVATASSLIIAGVGAPLRALLGSYASHISSHLDGPPLDFRSCRKGHIPRI